MEDIQKLPLPKHEFMGDWEGILHRDLVNHILELADDRGWELTNFKCHMSGDTNCLAASWDIKRTEEAPSDAVFSIGIIHANNKRHSMRLVGGLRMLDICSSVVFSEYPLGRHTWGSMARLWDQLHTHMMLFAKESRGYQRTIDFLDEMELSPIEIDGLLMTAGRGGLMKMSRVGQVDRLFDKYRSSAWNLLRCFGVGMQKGEPFFQMLRSHTFFKMVENVCSRSLAESRS